jgi:hypothetical protein
MILKINVKNYTLMNSYISVMILKHKSVGSLPNYPSKINSIEKTTQIFIINVSSKEGPT